MLIVDTGPLVAAADRADKDHSAGRVLLEDDEGPLLTTGLVIAEAAYLINRELVTTYASLPLGGADASVIALAERHGAVRVATLDRRHFTVVRPRHAQALELLP